MAVPLRPQIPRGTPPCTPVPKGFHPSGHPKTVWGQFFGRGRSHLERYLLITPRLEDSPWKKGEFKSGFAPLSYEGEGFTLKGSP